VVGVTLVMGLTVLLASVAGSMAVSMADDGMTEPAPVVAVGFEYDADAGTVTVLHEEGPPLERGDLRVVAGDGELGLAGTPGSSFAAGDTIVDARPYTPGERILVGWHAPDGSATVIAASTAPA
jgi:hypothetical protein